MKGIVRQLSQTCVSPSEPQAETSHEPLRARGGSESDFPHSILLHTAPSLRFSASVKRENQEPSLRSCKHQSPSPSGMKPSLSEQDVCRWHLPKNQKGLLLPHTLTAKTSASLFFQLLLFIDYFISLLISVSGKGLCGDLSLLSCKVFTLLLLVL